jgi:hypothetical protein
MSAWMIVPILFVLIFDILVIIRVMMEHDYYSRFKQLKLITLILILPIVGGVIVLKQLKRLDKELLGRSVCQPVLEKENDATDNDEFKVIGEYKASSERPKRYYGSGSSSSSMGYSSPSSDYAGSDY